MLLPQAEPGRFRVKVLDFGIAKLRPEHLSQEITIVRTQSGAVLGTVKNIRSARR